MGKAVLILIVFNHKFYSKMYIPMYVKIRRLFIFTKDRKFLKMGQSRPLFVYLPSFLLTMTNTKFD